MLATVVDTNALEQTVLVSLIAGVGVTVAFSIAVFGVARLTESNRDGRALAAAAFAGLTVLSLAVCVAAITIGIVVMTHKT